MATLLFPGRHHMLTKFQRQYLGELIADGAHGKKIDQIIFAVTSANHENTRRNPVPLYLRTMAITKLEQELPCEIKIYPIPDIQPTSRFADYILRQIFYQSGEKLTPQNTILACSTPSVIHLFKKLGFQNMPVELVSAKKNRYRALRPYEVIDLLLRSGRNWRRTAAWQKQAAEGTRDIYLKYSVGDSLRELFHDSLIDENADITDTRDYNTYAAGMDRSVEFKLKDIRPFIVEGKVVDAGCGTGSLIRLMAKEFLESDIIGIEATRKFYEFCKAQDYGESFVFFYRRNILDQNFKENTVNTFIYSSILHEVYSYIGKSALKKVLARTHKQLRNGGRIVIRDVVGPKNPRAAVFMELDQKDGKAAGRLEGLSTYAKFFRFAEDFRPRKIKYKKIAFQGKALIRLSLVDAYEYMSKMSYVDNWQSEMHEEFGFYSFPKWKTELRKAGFHIIPGSREFKNEYIIENKYRNKVALYRLEKNTLLPIDYPSTNMILVGEKKQH